MKATRRLAIVGSMALSAMLLAGPAYADDDPGLEVECEQEGTAEFDLQEAQQAEQFGLIPIAINDLIEKVNVGIAQDILNDVNVQDVTVVDSATLLSPGSNAVTCR